MSGIHNLAIYMLCIDSGHSALGESLDAEFPE